MGIYRPLVNRAQGERSPSDVEPSDRKITIPTLYGATRVPLAAGAAHLIMKGEKGATALVFAMGLSDAEGMVARKIDKHFPESGLGSSTFGEKLDPVFDGLAGVMLGAALLKGPNISKTAKMAVRVTLGKEGLKAARYLAMDHEYRDALNHRQLELKHFKENVVHVGKEATLEEFFALGLATATGETENRKARAALGGLAMAHAVASTWHGEQAGFEYEKRLEARVDYIHRYGEDYEA